MTTHPQASAICLAWCLPPSNYKLVIIMNKHPVVVLHTDNPLASHDILQEQHADLSIHTCDKYKDLPALVSQTNAEVVYSLRFGLNEPFPRETLVESETVKWVSVAGSGTDH